MIFGSSRIVPLLTDRGSVMAGIEEETPIRGKMNTSLGVRNRDDRNFLTTGAKTRVSKA
jgi:hypothetical protein